MSVVAARARELAGALRETRVGPFSLENIINTAAPMLGAGIAAKLKEIFMTNKTAIQLFWQLKEWGGLVAGVGVTLLYEMVRERLPNSAFFDYIVGGLAADMGAESFATLFGMPYALILGDGKLYVKNISGNNLTVYVDGQRYTYDTTNGTWSGPADIAEGVHDIVVIGSSKGRYIRQYTPKISVGSAAGGGQAGGGAA